MCVREGERERERGRERPGAILVCNDEILVGGIVNVHVGLECLQL